MWRGGKGMAPKEAPGRVTPLQPPWPGGCRSPGPGGVPRTLGGDPRTPFSLPGQEVVVVRGWEGSQESWVETRELPSVALARRLS